MWLQSAVSSFFFFQAEDGIRDHCVTGVQTCALPICDVARADLNVPQDDAGNITEDTRVRASVPAIELALKGGAAVMVTSHLGRPTEEIGRASCRERV